jgi:mRNA interferase RelE/StbE
VTEYAVAVSDHAAREIEDLPAAVAARMYAKLEGLAREPRPPGIKNLKGSRDLWRIRVGDYRAIYSSTTATAWSTSSAYVTAAAPTIEARSDDDALCHPRRGVRSSGHEVPVGSCAFVSAKR